MFEETCLEGLSNFCESLYLYLDNYIEKILQYFSSKIHQE